MTGNSHGEAPVALTVEWYTPPELFEKIGLTFDLDPASPGQEAVPWVPAARHYTEADNGLWLPWEGRVWLNPPYGQSHPQFMERFVQHRNGVALVYARTETSWWQAAAAEAQLVCFLRERLHFIRADGFRARSQMGSALIAFGDDCSEAIWNADLGWTVVTRRL